MTDTPQPGAAPAASAGSTLTEAPKDSSAQMIVALATVAGLVALGAGALLMAAVDHSVTGAALAITGTAIGALANALNTPTGIASVINSARKPGASQ
jgi:hypothetical protein